MTHRVNAFLYGSYMNFDVLVNHGIDKRDYQVAQLAGYALIIGSSANVVQNGLDHVFGIVTPLSHDELDTLYSREAQAKLGAQYMPEPVLVMTTNSELLPSLCYIAYDAVDGKAPATYIDTILSAAHAYHFPQAYIHHIESFK